MPPQRPEMLNFSEKVESLQQLEGLVPSIVSREEQRWQRAMEGGGKSGGKRDGRKHKGVLRLSGIDTGRLTTSVGHAFDHGLQLDCKVRHLCVCCFAAPCPPLPLCPRKSWEGQILFHFLMVPLLANHRPSRGTRGGVRPHFFSLFFWLFGYRFGAVR